MLIQSPGNLMMIHLLTAFSLLFEKEMPNTTNGGLRS